MKALGPVIVMGDYCPPVDINSSNSGPNIPKVLLDELMNRCELYAGSRSEIVTRLYVPTYIQSCEQLSQDVVAASILSSCTLHEMGDWNTADHLPISVEFSSTLEKTNQHLDFQWD